MYYCLAASLFKFSASTEVLGAAIAAFGGYSIYYSVTNNLIYIGGAASIRIWNPASDTLTATIVSVVGTICGIIEVSGYIYAVSNNKIVYKINMVLHTVVAVYNLLNGAGGTPSISYNPIDNSLRIYSWGASGLYNVIDIIYL